MENNTVKSKRRTTRSRTVIINYKTTSKVDTNADIENSLDFKSSDTHQIKYEKRLLLAENKSETKESLISPHNDTKPMLNNLKMTGRGSLLISTKEDIMHSPKRITDIQKSAMERSVNFKCRHIYPYSVYFKMYSSFESYNPFFNEDEDSTTTNDDEIRSLAKQEKFNFNSLNTSISSKLKKKESPVSVSSISTKLCEIKKSSYSEPIERPVSVSSISTKLCEIKKSSYSEPIERPVSVSINVKEKIKCFEQYAMNRVDIDKQNSVEKKNINEKVVLEELVINKLNDTSKETNRVKEVSELENPSNIEEAVYKASLIEIETKNRSYKFSSLMEMWKKKVDSTLLI
ncbi:hypothetical protein P3W45_001116 [Vairimorpha bombi]